MALEIEQKYRVVSHEPVVARLANMGATAGESVRQEDTYLNHPSRDFRHTGEAFRIRRVGSRNMLTYKGPKHAGPVKTREEIEIPFAEGPGPLEAMSSLLAALGFVAAAVVRKTRTPYELESFGRHFEVVLDDAEGLGPFVEVETLVEGDGDKSSAEAEVLALAAALGLTEVEPRSYLRMVLEGQAKGGAAG